MISLITSSTMEPRSYYTCNYNMIPAQLGSQVTIFVSGKKNQYIR
jgi:hypothetical protein